MTLASYRSVLPIPDRPYAGLATYDAKDPDTSFAPIEPLRPSVGGARVEQLIRDFSDLPREGDTVFDFAAGLYPTDYPVLPDRDRA